VVDMIGNLVSLEADSLLANTNSSSSSFASAKI